MAMLAVVLLYSLGSISIGDLKLPTNPANGDGALVLPANTQIQANKANIAKLDAKLDKELKGLADKLTGLTTKVNNKLMPAECKEYFIHQNCGWTSAWVCPTGGNLPSGASGFASDDGSIGFRCCCPA